MYVRHTFYSTGYGGKIQGIAVPPSGPEALERRSSAPENRSFSRENEPEAPAECLRNPADRLRNPADRSML
jgi:hypothetical protein